MSFILTINTCVSYVHDLVLYNCRTFSSDFSVAASSVSSLHRCFTILLVRNCKDAAALVWYRVRLKCAQKGLFPMPLLPGRHGRRAGCTGWWQRSSERREAGGSDAIGRRAGPRLPAVIGRRLLHLGKVHGKLRRLSLTRFRAVVPTTAGCAPPRPLSVPPPTPGVRKRGLRLLAAESGNSTTTRRRSDAACSLTCAIYDGKTWLQFEFPLRLLHPHPHPHPPAALEQRATVAFRY